MNDLIKVLVVEDHLIARLGIAAIINAQPDMAVVAEAVLGLEAVEIHRRYQPDVTLMDLRLPDIWGTDAIKKILQHTPPAKIIVLTSYTGDAGVSRALKAGAVGYILKDVLDKELVNAVRLGHNGTRYVSPTVAAVLSTNLAADELSPGELRVLHFIVAGHSNKEIAATLGITENTVKSYLRNIFLKLDVEDRTAAAILAVRRGLVQLDV